MSTADITKSVVARHNPDTPVLQSGSSEVAVTDLVQNISYKNRNEADKKKNFPIVTERKTGLSS